MSHLCWALKWPIPFLSVLFVIRIPPIHSAPISCSYKIPKFEEVVVGVHQENENETDHSRQRRAFGRDWAPLRIALHFDESIYKLDPLNLNYVRDKLLPEAVGFWENVLQVHRSHVPIRLARKCVAGQYYVHKTDKRQSCAGHCMEFTKCGEVVVPEEHLFQCRYCLSQLTMSCETSGPADGRGVGNADFLLYVSAVDSERCDNEDTVAYAAHCQLEAKLDRPIAGHVNLCPSSVSSHQKDQEVLSSTVKHEVLHALGFSAGLYAFYRDEHGRPRTARTDYGKPVNLSRELGYYMWSETTVKTVTRKNWWTRTGVMDHEVNLMVTPKVREAVRAHFGCEDLEGAELENQGFEGTAMTHWEKRLFENEAMTGTHTQNPVYSAITLAMMEDTGWYRPNYAMADRFHWGRNLGCDFAKKSCGEWIKRRKDKGLSVSPFCDRVKGQKHTTTTCTDTRDSVALCNLVQYDIRLSRQFQNFDRLPGISNNSVAFFGGSVELADYCPYNQEFEWKNDSTFVHRRDSRCEFLTNTPPGKSNAAMETYGPDSRCFQHLGKWIQRKCASTRTFEHYGAGCYEFHCVEGKLWLDLLNGTQAYPCHYPGQKIFIRRIKDTWLHTGIIVCPSCKQICEQKYSNFQCAPDDYSAPRVGDTNIAIPCSSTTLYFCDKRYTVTSIVLGFLLLTNHIITN